MSKFKFYMLNLWKGEFNKNQRHFVLSGILSASHDTLVIGIFLTGYALWLGATDSQAGMISSVIFMAQLLQVLFVGLWKRVKLRRIVFPLVVFVSRFIIFLIIILPNVINKERHIDMPILGNITIGFLIFLCIFLVGIIGGSSAGIQMNLWMMGIIPRNIRGTFFSARNRITMILSIIISFLMSNVLDYFKMDGRDYWGFLIIFSLALILAFLDMLVIFSIGDIEEVRTNQNNKHFLKELMIPLKDSYYMKLIVSMVIWGIGLQISLPFFGVYQINHLKIGYSHIALLSSVQTFFSFITIKYWGRLANRKHWMWIYNLSVVLFVIQMVFWLLVKPNHSYLLPLLYLQAGIFGPAYTMAVFNLPYSYLKKDNETAYISITTVIFSIANMLGVFIGGWLLKNRSLSGWQVTDHFLSNNITITILLGFIAILYGHFFVSPIERNE